MWTIRFCIGSINHQDIRASVLSFIFLFWFIEVMLTQELGNKLYPKRYVYFIAFLVGITFMQGFWKETLSSDIIFEKNAHSQNIGGSSIMVSRNYILSYLPSGRKPSRNTDEATFANLNYSLNPYS